MKATELKQIVKSAVEAAGYVFWGVEFTSGDGSAIVRVYIDSKGLTVDDCAKASAQIGAALEVADKIHSRYRLEVSSPGLEKPLFELEQYRLCIGQEIQVRLQEKQQGQQHFTGELIRVTDTDIVLCHEGVEVTLPYLQITKANVIVKW